MWLCQNNYSGTKSAWKWEITAHRQCYVTTNITQAFTLIFNGRNQRVCRSSRVLFALLAFRKFSFLFGIHFCSVALVWLAFSPVSIAPTRFFFLFRAPRISFFRDFAYFCGCETWHFFLSLAHSLRSKTHSPYCDTKESLNGYLQYYTYHFLGSLAILAFAFMPFI